jgi:YidC/Oxa1 family membrane protein insertase
MGFLDEIMVPFRWLVSAIMVGFHDGLSALGMPAASGWTWTLAIIGLVLVIRAALIPVFLQQVKAQRRMRLLQPDLMKLQEKYQGKSDPASRQAMAQEQMELYKKHGTNPFSACLPMLIQVPFFLALFQVLSGISALARQDQGIGAMSRDQVVQFDQSGIFGAPLTAAVLHGGGGDQAAVVVLTVLMILAMTAAQFVTQKLILARNATSGAPEAPLCGSKRSCSTACRWCSAWAGSCFPLAS